MFPSSFRSKEIRNYRKEKRPPFYPITPRVGSFSLLFSSSPYDGSFFRESAFPWILDREGP